MRDLLDRTYSGSITYKVIIPSDASNVLAKNIAPAKYAAKYSFFCIKYIFLVDSWCELVFYYLLL